MSSAPCDTSRTLPLVVTMVPTMMATMMAMVSMVSTKPVNAICHVGQHVTEVTPVVIVAPVVMVAPIVAVSATVMSVPAADLLHNPRVALDCCHVAHFWQREDGCCAQTDQEYRDG